MKPARVIAHRGGAGDAPENTLAAFRVADEAGATWVECDAVLLNDGEVVLHHDLTLERTTNGTGKIADRSLPYIQSLDAGTWFGPQFHGEPIPSLADTLQAFEDLRLRANFELKVHGDEAQELAQAVADDWQQDADELSAVGVIANHARVTPAQIRDISSTGLFTGVYTVNDPARIVRLWDAGLDTVITDFPERFPSGWRAAPRS